MTQPDKTPTATAPPGKAPAASTAQPGQAALLDIVYRGGRPLDVLGAGGAYLHEDDDAALHLERHELDTDQRETHPRLDHDPFVEHAIQHVEEARSVGGSLDAHR